MKISYNCYRYAPEQAEIKLNGISINHKYSAFNPFNPHNKLYKLLISDNVIADIRKIIRNDDSNIGKNEHRNSTDRKTNNRLKKQS